MKRFVFSLFPILAFLFFTGCNPSPQIERSLDPWVMRINLDERSNMIALALNQELYAAYDARLGALYKVWKGDIHLTGPVFDNIHGEQPYSRGEAYLEDQLKESPWFYKRGGEARPVWLDYKGYTFANNQVTITYELDLPSGETITLQETPEFIRNSDGRPGFERVIKTTGVPKGAEIRLALTFKHLQSESDLATNGEWVERNFNEQSFEWGSSLTGKGIAKLNSNLTTWIRTYFEPKATAHIQTKEEQSDLVAEEQMEEAEPEVITVSNDNMGLLAEKGKKVIAQSDCAACHAMNKSVIGPSYSMIAQKYESTPEVVDQLSNKIINGGSGVWGQRAMAPHPMVSKGDAEAMAAYILSTVPDDAMERKPGLAVNFYDISQPLASLPEVVAGQSPNVSEVYPQINFQSGNPDIGQATDENFSGFTIDFVMTVDGFLEVPESATYDFQFIANNGGKLMIDGEMITQGHRYEGTFVGEQAIYLKKGLHKIHIDFYHHLFGKYLILKWRTDRSQDYELIPATAFSHNPIDIQPTAPGIKEIVRNRAPGFGASLEAVHPSFDLSPLRPEGFEPRVGDHTFMEDGRLVLCTWDGEVYIMENVLSTTDPSQSKVTKIADGLCEPLGIEVVDGDIYVLQRWELTKLVDEDGDEITDTYQKIATWGATADFHEWTFGLVYKDGFFYATTGIALGPFHDDQHVDRGKALKIGMDGSYSHIAYGLKEPNGIGLGVDGELFVTENEGEFVPVPKFMHIPMEGKPFYGNETIKADSLPPGIKQKPPAIWLPQNEIGNSPSQPIVLHHGPYEGQMIHGEITHGGIKRDFIEKVNGEYQGAVFRFSQGLEAGINRMEWGSDGALYVSGLGGAQDYGHKNHQFGLQRLTYNGNPAFEMLAIRAKANGLEIEFTKPLRIGDGISPEDYLVQQWYYYWTEEVESQAKRELENLPIRSVSLSEDRKKVFLELGNMKPEHVLHVQLTGIFLSAENDPLWSNEGWYTMNNIPDETGGVNPYAFQEKSNQLAVPEKDAGWSSLFNGKTAKAWQSIDGASDWKAKKEHLIPSGEQALLVAENQFGNFELELEYKLETGAEGGVLYNIAPAAANADQLLSGSPRFQFIDDRTREDAKNIHTHKTGALYDLLEPEYTLSKPANTYNHLRLVVTDGQVEHWVNGYRILSYELGSAELKNKLTGSIYGAEADFSAQDQSRIALFAASGTIWIRNVRIKGEVGMLE